MLPHATSPVQGRAVRNLRAALENGSSDAGRTAADDDLVMGAARAGMRRDRLRANVPDRERDAAGFLAAILVRARDDPFGDETVERERPAAL